MEYSGGNKKRKRGRPRQGGEKKKARSIRIEPTKLSIIVGRFGSLQKFFDDKVDETIRKIIKGEI